MAVNAHLQRADDLQVEGVTVRPTHRGIYRRIAPATAATGAEMKDPKTGLLPCPFCGCKFMDTNNASGIFRDFGYGGFIARCGNPECGAEIAADTLDDVRAQWNRRTP